MLSVEHIYFANPQAEGGNNLDEREGVDAQKQQEAIALNKQLIIEVQRLKVARGEVMQNLASPAAAFSRWTFAINYLFKAIASFTPLSIYTLLFVERCSHLQPFDCCTQLFAKSVSCEFQSFICLSVFLKILNHRDQSFGDGQFNMTLICLDIDKSEV